MRRLFELSSAHWEKRQLAKVAQALAAGSDGVGAREFGIQIAASCTLEGQLIEKIKMLTSIADFWEVLPPMVHTVKFRCLAFRMMSRAGSVEQNVGLPNRLPPVAFFIVFENATEENCQKVEAIPECLMDSWSVNFMRDHRGHLGSLKAQCKLRLRAHTSKKDVGKRESLHAAVRRVIQIRSQHTNH